jgi:hypothetical protein
MSEAINEILKDVQAVCVKFGAKTTTLAAMLVHGAMLASRADDVNSELGDALTEHLAQMFGFIIENDQTLDSAQITACGDEILAVTKQLTAAGSPDEVLAAAVLFKLANKR